MNTNKSANSIEKMEKKELLKLLGKNMHVGCTIENDNGMTYVNEHTLPMCMNIAASGASCQNEKSCKYMAFKPNANGETGKCWVGNTYHDMGSLSNSKCQVPVYIVPPNLKSKNCQNLDCLRNSETEYLQKMNQKFLSDIEKQNEQINENKIKMMSISEGISYQKARSKFMKEEQKRREAPYFNEMEKKHKQYEETLLSFKDFHNNYNTLLDETDKNIKHEQHDGLERQEKLEDLKRKIQTQDELIKINQNSSNNKNTFIRYLQITVGIITIIAFFLIPFFVFGGTEKQKAKSMGNTLGNMGINLGFGSNVKGPSANAGKGSSNSNSVYNILNRLGIKN